MSPTLVHLGRRAIARRDHLLSAIERQAPGQAWAFRLCPDELRFARRLLEARTQLWLFRSDQRRACADFVVVDMSAPEPGNRTAHVIEVKLGRPVRTGRGMQFTGTPRALAQLRAEGRLTHDSPTRRWLGGREALLGLWGID